MKERNSKFFALFCRMGALRKRMSDMEGTSNVCGAREGGIEGGVSRQVIFSPISSHVSGSIFEP